MEIGGEFRSVAWVRKNEEDRTQTLIQTTKQARTDPDLVVSPYLNFAGHVLGDTMVGKSSRLMRALVKHRVRKGENCQHQRRSEMKR